MYNRKCREPPAPKARHAKRKEQKTMKAATTGIIRADDTQALAVIARGQVTPELFAVWQAYGIKRSEKTIQTYTRNIRNFSEWMQLHGITEPVENDIFDYRAELAAKYKPATVAAYMAAVKVFFKFCDRIGAYPNVAAEIPAGKVEASHKADYLTVEQSANLIDSIDRTTLKGKRDYAIVQLMITTALRVISVQRATVGNITIHNGVPVLYYQGKGHEDNDNFVNLAPDVQDALADYLNARGDVDIDAPLFASCDHSTAGEPLTTRSISRIVKNHLIDSGINSPRIVAHSLRHTAAVTNMKNGGTLEETRQLMGHKDERTTRIYVEDIARDANRSEIRIAEAIAAARRKSA